MNLLKRRMTAPTAEIDPKVTLTAMQAPGYDADRGDEAEGAVVIGYVANVKVGGTESVHCHTRSPR